MLNGELAPSVAAFGNSWALTEETGQVIKVTESIALSQKLSKKKNCFGFKISDVLHLHNGKFQITLETILVDSFKQIEISQLQKV